MKLRKNSLDAKYNSRPTFNLYPFLPLGKVKIKKSFSRIFRPIKTCPLYRNSFIMSTVYYKGSISKGYCLSLFFKTSYASDSK